jgi:hypothetical protein
MVPADSGQISLESIYTVILIPQAREKNSESFSESLLRKQIRDVSLRST